MDEINLPIKHESKPYLMIPFPDGATNGDVVKILFPDAGLSNLEAGHILIRFCNGCSIRADLTWWNAPYKRESDTEKRKEWPLKPCINYEDGCEEWTAGCPCVYYKAESEE